MKKKSIAFLVAVSLTMGLLAGCGPASSVDDKKDTEKKQESADEKNENEEQGSSSDSLETIKIGASPSPHAEILEEASKLLEEEGYQLDIIEFTDYVQPNEALNGGDLDANYFQHFPYLESFNEERGMDLVSAGSIHYEPFGIYGGKTEALEDLEDGASVAVPNDSTNEARALLLLESEGLIKLKTGAGVEATVKDIEENPKNLDIKEIEAAQIPHSLQDVDIAVINGNYALEAGLHASKDALAIEDTDSVGATTYGNVVAVRAGDEEDAAIQALIKVLESDSIKQFIESKYEGAVVSLF